MRSSLLILVFQLLIAGYAHSANIRQQALIACLSDDATMKGRHQSYNARKSSEKTKSRFSEWLFAENFSNQQSKIEFEWYPKTDSGPRIKINTTEKPHNLIKIRSYTKNSLIVVSSASNPLSSESWTFALNFDLETLLATRVQSNLAVVKGEVITYNCIFDSAKPTISESTQPLS